MTPEELEQLKDDYENDIMLYDEPNSAARVSVKGSPLDRISVKGASLVKLVEWATSHEFVDSVCHSNFLTPRNSTPYS